MASAPDQRRRPPACGCRTWRNRPSDQRTVAVSGPMPFNRVSMAAGEVASSSRRLEQGVPFRLDALQLLQQDLEPIQLADAGLAPSGCSGRGPAVACPQLLPAAHADPCAAARSRTPPGRRVGPFDPVDVPHPLAHQRLALAADTPAVPPPAASAPWPSNHTRGSPRLKAIRVRTRGLAIYRSGRSSPADAGARSGSTRRRPRGSRFLRTAVLGGSRSHPDRPPG